MAKRTHGPQASGELQDRQTRPRVSLVEQYLRDSQRPHSLSKCSLQRQPLGGRAGEDEKMAKKQKRLNLQFYIKSGDVETLPAGRGID